MRDSGPGAGCSTWCLQGWFPSLGSFPSHCTVQVQDSLPEAVTVEEAIGDLPSLKLPDGSLGMGGDSFFNGEPSSTETVVRFRRKLYTAA